MIMMKVSAKQPFAGQSSQEPLEVPKYQHVSFLENKWYATSFPRGMCIYPLLKPSWDANIIPNKQHGQQSLYTDDDSDDNRLWDRQQVIPLHRPN